MNDTIRSGTVYRNQGGAAQARTQSVPSRQGVEYLAQNPSEMGAGHSYAAGAIATDASSNPRRSHGGQASLRIFGVTDRCHGNTAANVKAKAPQAEVRPRIIGGLSFSQRAPLGFAEEAAAEYEAHLAEVAEARAHQLDEEADRYACSFAGTGYTEYLMACEG